MADGSLLFNTKIDNTGFSKGMKTLGSIAGLAAKGVVVAIGAAATAVGAFGVSAIKTGMEFEAQMARVNAISGATASEFDKLNDLAIELGASTAFSASEAAGGMENLASAGFSANEIIGAMPGLLDLAAVSGGDVAVASEIAAGALNGFGLEASSAGHVANVFARAAADTNAEVADMGEAMKYIAPVAHAMGLSLEETAAAVGILSDANIKGGQAGTTLRAALTRLANPTKKMKDTMDELGLSFFDVQGNMKPLKGIIEELQNGTEGLTQQQKNQAMATLFGQEALSGMLALVGAGPEKLDELTKSFEDSEGAAAEMAAIINDTLTGRIEELGGAFETLKILIYQGLEGPLKGAAETATGYVQQLISAFNDGGFEGLATSVGDVLAQIIQNVAEFLPQFIEYGSSIIINLVQGLINNAPTLAESAVSIITGLVNSILELLPMLLELGANLLLNIIQGITQNLPSLIENASNILTTIIDTLIEYGPLLISAGAQMIITLIQGLAKSMPELIPKAIDLIETIVMSLTENAHLIIAAALELVLALALGLINALPRLIETVPKLVIAIADVINDNAPKIIETGIKIIIALIKGLIQAIPTLIANIPKIIEAIVKAFMAFQWLNLGKTLITNIGNGIKNMRSNIAAQADDVANGVKTSISNKWSSAKQWGTDVISNIKNGISASTSGIRSTASTLAGNVKTAISTAWSNVKSIGSNLITGIWNGISDKTGWILGKIKGFGSSVIKGIKGIFGIKSPSRVMRDEVGKYITQGIGVGIEKDMPALNRDVKKQLAGLTKEMQARVEIESTGVGRSVVGGNNQSSTYRNIKDLLDKKQNDNSGEGTVITGNNFIIREESDIEKIARALDEYRKKKFRGKGVVPT